MERVETLLNKLQQQFVGKAPPADLLLTVQILQAELLHLKAGTAIMPNNVSIDMPNSIPVKEKEAVFIENESEKIIEILQVDEAEIEAELQELKRNAENFNKLSTQNKPHILFDIEDEFPTLVQYSPKYKQVNTTVDTKEINEVLPLLQSESSINDKLKPTSIPLSDTLTGGPIRDLKKAIGVNDRFLFINELFRGDEAMYERSLKTINNFTILPEAEYWIQRELKVKIGWSESNEVVKQFNQLVKRRFS
jgi:hypothetical protein